MVLQAYVSGFIGRLLGMSKRLFLVVAVLAGLGIHAGAQAPVKRPMWAMPPGNAPGPEPLKELFAQPEEWTKARSEIGVLGAADHVLTTKFTDEELRADMAMMKAWHLKLGLEVGAIKEWGTTGDVAFAHSSKMWDRLIADGAPLDAIAMDEPLACARHKLHKTMSYAVENTAIYISLVRKKYPEMQVGDIEPYPGFQTPELMEFLDALQARLKEMGVRGLDFYRVDVDWMHFHPGDDAGKDGWKGVRNLEAEVHKRGIPFSLIYWAADLPSQRNAGKLTEETWEKGILEQEEDYRKAGGVPDEYVLESWVGSPSHSVPETQKGTFMHSVVAFNEVLDKKAK
jgi:hypothetical protein